ncbi:MAG: Tol-Pal system beta propeller repeat protein TolB [Gammaproteobacteria bacterium]|nr:Tol-Pal system beta propeller repeat protein TolB [Gammaproteobacteria bacterium]
MSGKAVLILLLTAVFLPAGAGAAESLDTIIIDEGYDKQTRIAVVPFQKGPEFAGEAEMADIVAFDLSRSGQFAPLERDNMLSLPGRPEQVLFRDWRVLGMEYVVIGNLQTQSSGDTRVRFWLFDVVNGRQMLAGEVTGTRAQWRDMAHEIADDLFEAITGIRGAFATKILYVLSQNAGSPAARYSLEMADSDGERSRTLVSSDQPIMSPSWAPDGRRVAYVTWQNDRQIIVVLDLTTGQRETYSRFSGINGSPVFSPDGRSLVMVLSRDGNPEIYVMNLADRSLRRLTRHYAIDTEPSFSPDGRYVIFTSDRVGAPQIYRIELATNELERLTWEGGYNARARLLPDGRHLVYVHRRNGRDYIAWHDLERDDVRVLTGTSLGQDESPSLAPNGTMLMYATLDRGRGILAVVSIDGRVKYRLPSSSGDVREPAWSPYLDFRML